MLYTGHYNTGAVSYRRTCGDLGICADLHEIIVYIQFNFVDLDLLEIDPDEDWLGISIGETESSIYCYGSSIFANLYFLALSINIV